MNEKTTPLTLTTSSLPEAWRDPLNKAIDQSVTAAVNSAISTQGNVLRKELRALVISLIQQSLREILAQQLTTSGSLSNFLNGLNLSPGQQQSLQLESLQSTERDR